MLANTAKIPWFSVFEGEVNTLTFDYNDNPGLTLIGPFKNTISTDPNGVNLVAENAPALLANVLTVTIPALPVGEYYYDGRSQANGKMYEGTFSVIPTITKSW